MVELYTPYERVRMSTDVELSIYVFLLAGCLGLELVHRVPVVTERTHVFQGGLPVRALGVEEVEHAEPAAPIRELHGGANTLGAWQIDVAESARLLALGQNRRQRRLDL